MYVRARTISNLMVNMNKYFFFKIFNPTVAI